MNIDLYYTLLCHFSEHINSEKFAVVRGFSHNKIISLENHSEEKNYTSFSTTSTRKIPDTTTHLWIVGGFDMLLYKSVLPNSIKDLVVEELFFEDDITQTSEEVFPNSLEILRLKLFNRPLKKGVIPNTIKKLYLSYHFNQELKQFDIPDSVTHLYFGTEFDKPIKKGDIPESVKYLLFGEWFNKQFEKGVLPNSIEYLRLGDHYDKKISDENLPSNLIVLDLCETMYEKYHTFNIKKNLIVCMVINIEEDYLFEYNDFSPIQIDYKNKDLFDKCIEDFTPNKFIGNIIKKELIERTVNPHNNLF